MKTAFFAPLQPLLDLSIQSREGLLTGIDVKTGHHTFVDSETIQNILKEYGEEPAINVGGSATNVFKVLRHLGNDCTVMGLTGSDAYAKKYQSLLEEKGIQCKLTTVDRDTTGTALVCVDPSGERTMLTNLGAASKLHAFHVKDKDVPRNGHVHLEGYLVHHPDHLLLKLAKQAKERGCTVSLDLSDASIIEGNRAYFNEVLRDEYIDVLFGNESEMRKLADKEFPEEGCAKYAAFCNTVVVTMGKEGGWVQGNNDWMPRKFAAMPVKKEEAVDTTGAGDFFAGGFLHGWKQGDDIETCVKRGAAAAATVIQSVGTDLNEEGWALLDENIRENTKVINSNEQAA